MQTYKYKCEYCKKDVEKALPVKGSGEFVVCPDCHQQVDSFVKMVQARNWSAADAALARNPHLVNARYDDGWSVINMVARIGDIEAITYLSKNGTDLNKQDGQGWTPLYHAACWGHIEAAKALLDLGANPKLGLPSGMTPVSIARSNKHEAIAVMIENAKPVVAETKGCFIATACYGSYDHPDVMEFRWLRDNHLAMNRCGRWFTSAYYRMSPPIARFLSRHSLLSAIVRLSLLSPLAQWISRNHQRGNEQV